jgi:hypothetical protein
MNRADRAAGGLAACFLTGMHGAGWSVKQPSRATSITRSRRREPLFSGASRTATGHSGQGVERRVRAEMGCWR